MLTVHNRSSHLPRKADGTLTAVLDGCAVLYRTKANELLCSACATYDATEADPVVSWFMLCSGRSLCCSGCCQEFHTPNRFDLERVMVEDLPEWTDAEGDHGPVELVHETAGVHDGHSSFADYPLY